MLLKFTDWLVYEVFKLDAGVKAVQALHFFIYDSVKITLLLFGMIWVIGIFRSYLPQEKVKKWMKERGVWSYWIAALFGALTPFCSCSSIPIFLGFLRMGIPLGVTFAFLITSPLINEYLVVLMIGFFGWKIAALYVVSGILLGVTSGVVLNRMNLARHLVSDFMPENQTGAEEVFESFKSRVRFGWDEAVMIVKKIWLWVLIGVAIGAGIHNYVPEEWIHSAIAQAGIFSVPIAVIVGVPLYGSCAAIVPIAVVLFQKGVPLGTALAFMMAIVALSLPEAVMLRRAMKLPLILIFFGVTTLAIILIGYIFNALAGVLY